MSNSALDAIYTSAMHRFKEHERNISDREAADVAVVLQGRDYERDLDDTINKVYDAQARELDDMTDKQYERETDRLGAIVADSLMHIALDNARILRHITQDEERDLERAKRDLERLLSRGGGRRDRDRNDRDRNRRNRDRNRNVSSDRPERNERDREEPRSSRRDRVDTSISNEPPAPELNDRDIIMKGNFNLLPVHLKDTPLYYAGLEKVIYNAETDALDVVIFGENVKVDYEAHRTDIHLAPNRAVKNVGKSIEELQNQMQKAAQNRIDAFVKDEPTNEQPTNDVELRRPINTPTVIDDLFAIDEPVTNSEAYIRSQLAEMYGPKVNEVVYTTNVEHTIATLKPRVKTDPASAESIVAEFKSLTVTLMQMVNLTSLRDWLNAAQVLMTDDEYRHLHTVVNEVVCNALTVSLKAGVRTPSWLVDFDQIVNVVNSQKTNSPNFDMLLMNNLTMLLPNFVVEEGALKLVRAYIFLPFSKNEVVFASAGAYGTVTQNDRPAFFNLLKSVYSNLAGSGTRAWYTIVTSDNSYLTVRPMHTATTEAFYVFKPL